MIQISEGAARKIRTLMAKQGIDDGGLRVGVKGGGCSGLSYTFAWERQPRLGDEVFEGPEGTKIFVDKKSLLYLNGTILDYDTNLISKGFVFNNPNAKTTCGWGSSFGAKRLFQLPRPAAKAEHRHDEARRAIPHAQPSVPSGLLLQRESRRTAAESRAIVVPQRRLSRAPRSDQTHRVLAEARRACAQERT